MDFLAGLPAQGDLIGLRIGPKRVYLACDPDLIHHTLTHPAAFEKGGAFFDRLRLLVGYGLRTSDRIAHKRQRRLAQPAFHRERIAAYVQVMVAETSKELHTWREKVRFALPGQLRGARPGTREEPS